MRFKNKKEDKKENQNVQENNWQDEGSQNVEERNNAIENVEAEGKEQIPQLTDPEKKALQK